jgi:hypothetical protein
MHSPNSTDSDRAAQEPTARMGATPEGLTDERQAFEAWHDEVENFATRGERLRDLGWTEALFAAWQARAALAATPKEPRGEPRKHLSTIITALADLVKLHPREFKGHPDREFIDREQAMVLVPRIRDAACALIKCAAPADRAAAPMPSARIEDCPELNLSNYDSVDVERLNDWAIRADAELERLYAALAAAPASPAQQATEYPNDPLAAIVAASQRATPASPAMPSDLHAAILAEAIEARRCLGAWFAESPMRPFDHKALVRELMRGFDTLIADRARHAAAELVASSPAAGGAPTKLPGVAVALSMCREANTEAKLPTPMCWDLALYVSRLETALGISDAGQQSEQGGGA